MPDFGGQDAHNELPRRAAVTPRVRTSPGSGALTLESVIKGFLDARARGMVLLHAPAGGGKTTALAHLRAALGKIASVVIVDEPPSVDAIPQVDHLILIAHRPYPSGHWLATFELVPWAEDEWIEYLAANHRPMVASVVSRLKDDPTRYALGGSPQLWAIVLGAMSSDELLATARDALRHHLSALLPDNRAHVAAGAVAVNVIGCDPGVLPPSPPKLPQEVVSLLRHPIVRLMLAADWLTMSLAAGGAPSVILAQPLERDLLKEAGVALRSNAPARARLADLLRERNRTYDAAAASLLLAADPDWRPRSLAARLLRHARLDGAQWSGIDLRDVCLTGATLRSACLREAKLDSAKLSDGDFWHADLAKASLRGASAVDADFTGATLRHCDADGADLTRARLEDADLESARLNNCDFWGANLARAHLRGAWLAGAKFSQAVLDEADLSDVALAGAHFTAVDFRTALLSRTSFEGAHLLACNFEGLALRDANFQHSRVGGSLFTGSRLPRVNFNGAQLINTGLSDVDWPGADLRNAELHGASFHMGSSRSGLVGSPIASEGTRTGFYTDDYNDQDFKAPEEIRKANLCGADLRGAKVEQCDFYLVDLRGAKYTEDQRDHFARCGAILCSRVT